MNGAMENIDAAIRSYDRRPRGGAGGGAPYDADSLAEIYAPRVRELLELQTAGFTRAVWKWDNEAGYNHWHGVTP